MTLQQATLTICLVCVSMWAGYSMAQPQPRLRVTDPNWGMLEFDNGSQWYIRASNMQAIWAIPEAESKKLGYKTRIYGPGYTINADLTVKEIVNRMARAEKDAINLLLEEMEE